MLPHSHPLIQEQLTHVTPSGDTCVSIALIHINLISIRQPFHLLHAHKRLRNISEYFSKCYAFPFMIFMRLSKIGIKISLRKPTLWLNIKLVSKLFQIFPALPEKCSSDNCAKLRLLTNVSRENFQSKTVSPYGPISITMN